MRVNPPTVKFEFQPMRIIKYSDLTSIFTKDQLTEYTENNEFEEIMFEPR
jgi:hypothetical protein